MPTPSRRPHPRQKHSLANLPRPIAERERRAGAVTRRLGIAVVAVTAVAVGMALGGNGTPNDDTGVVAGAVTSPEPSLRPAPDPTPLPTRTPRPTPTPLPTPLPASELTGYVSPLPRGRLTLPFGPSPWGSRIVDGEKFHDGIDLATFCGDRIVAAHGGEVLAAGRKYDEHMGWLGDIAPYLERIEAKKLWSTLPIVVVIDDGNGYRSIYAHFSKVEVKRGDVVEAGDFLGYEGMTGRASGCHLHYTIFSPIEEATFGIDPDVVKRMLLPDQLVARIDPQLVLPPIGKPTKSPTPAPSAS